MLAINKSNLIYLLIGVVLTTAFFLFLYFQGCGRSTYDSPALDSAAFHAKIESYYKGQEAVYRAQIDSLQLAIANREPQITYLTKQYYSSIPDRFTVSDSDAAALFIKNFIREEVR
jgi:hypothetical protein